MTRNSKPRQGKPAPPWEAHAISYPQELPICQRREDIITAIKEHQVIVLSGETGSGKTTQIPKMCLEAGRGQKGKIACTQPRRVAALSVAQRVAEELGVNYGREVGSKIRFTDKTSKATRVKFLTDGMLLAEAQADRSLREYDTIIIDEAHERSLNIDFLLGRLNQLLKKRADLKVIITSATIDVDKFSEAFDNAPVIEVSGRTYPVDVIYAPLDELLEDSGEFTYIEGVVESVERIAQEYNHGDILVFLPTEKDIRETMDTLRGRYGQRMEILPCFGRLSSQDQQRIFAPCSKRKAVLATNIAETSLTIPGIRFVIDTGLARISRYNPRGRTKRLPIEKISQSSANQRKGRCGRVAEGVCIRLYSESDFDSRRVYSVPEIQRSNLAEVILRMEASKLGDVESFPFIDPPSSAAIKSGYLLLQELGALDEGKVLTPVGRKLAKLPADPTVGRMLLQAEKEGVVEQMLVIASALSIQDPRERPLGKETQAAQAHKPFAHRESDFLGLLNIWEAFHDEFERMTQGKLRRFCKKHFLSYLRMREWNDVREQLSRSLRDFERSTHAKHSLPDYRDAKDKQEKRKWGGSEYEAIHKCLVSGLLSNPARKDEINHYRATSNRKAMIFPGSALFDRRAMQGKKQKAKEANKPRKTPSPHWILAGEILETNRLYARCVAAIDPQWLIQLGNHVIDRKVSEPFWDPEQGRVLAKERLLLRGLELRVRSISYLKVDPPKATEIFIREGLLSEEFEAPHAFLDHNQKLKKRIQNAQTTMQISSWIGIEEAAYRFYAAKLQGVASIHDINRFLKPHGGTNSDFLFMAEEDLQSEEHEPVDLESFPESVELENSALPIEYNYNPGGEDDGISLKVPYGKARSIDSPMLDWLIPGHLETKTHCLLKALPKEIRRKLAPLADTSKKIAKELRPSEKTLVESLACHLEANYGIETYQSDWKPDVIPQHLQTRVDVVDSQGQTVASSRNVDEIRKTLKKREQESAPSQEPARDALWEAARRKWEQDEIALGELPDRDSKLSIGDINGVPVFAFLGLRVFGDSVGLRLFASRQEAKNATHAGIQKLIEHELRYELAWIEKDIKELNRVGPNAVALISMEQLQADALQHMKSHLLRHEIETLDKTAIAARAAEATREAKGFLYKLTDLLIEILELRQQLVVSKTLPQDLKAEVDRMIPKSFLRDTPHYALREMPRYLKAIAKRAKSRSSNPKRDHDRFAEISRYRQECQALAKQRNMPAEQEAVDQLKWTIEEYTVSLFAQDLGTAYPVSAKRIRKKLQELGSHGAIEATLPTAQDANAAKALDRPTSKDLESLKSLFER